MNILTKLFSWTHVKIFPEDSLLQKVVIFSVLVIVNLFIGLESFGVTISDDLLRGYFDLNKDQEGWIGHAFLTGMAIAMPGYAYFCKRFGLKTYFCTGLGVFVISNFIGGLSTSYFLLLLCRAISGMSGGMALISSGMILKKVVHSKLHPHALSLATNLAGLGFAIALWIGGVVAQSLHWRFVFFIDVIIVSIALFLIWAALKEDVIREHKTLRMDYWSYGYYVFGLVGLVVFFSQVKAEWNTLGWRSDFSLILAAVTIISFILLIRRCLTREHALFSVEIFKNFSMILMTLTSFVMGLTIWSGTLYIFMLLGPFQYEHITTGLVLSTFGCSVFLAGTVVFFLKRVNPLYFILLGLVCVGSGCFVNHLVTLQSSPQDIILVLILRGIGVGMCLHPIVEFTNARVSLSLQQECGTLIATARMIGAALVSPIMGVIATMRMAYHNLRFGEQVDPTSGVFRYYIREFQLYAEHGTSKSWHEAMHRAKGYVIENIKAQSEVLSDNDAFFLLGWLVMILMITIGIYECVLNKQKEIIETSFD